MNSKSIHQIAHLLLWVGGVNWGLVGLFNLDLVQAIFGPSSISQLLYLLIGVSAVFAFVTHKDTCEVCKAKSRKRK